MRHWSFIVTDKKYMVLLAVLVLLAGLFLSYRWRDATQLARAGNFVVCIGVWMSMRFTLRQGLSKTFDARDDQPVLPGGALNANWFNIRAFAQGDAVLQVWGFAVVLVGSAVWAYGDWILKQVSPGAFD
jgi:hypothetical protein